MLRGPVGGCSTRRPPPNCRPPLGGWVGEAGSSVVEVIETGFTCENIKKCFFFSELGIGGLGGGSLGLGGAAVASGTTVKFEVAIHDKILL